MVRPSDSRFVALLRGVNVGQAKRVAMADLRDACAGLGYRNVRSLLNSGNLVFDASGTSVDLAAELTACMRERFELDVAVTVLNASDVALVEAENELRAVATTPSRLLVSLWRDHPAARARLVEFAEQDWGTERVHVGTRAAYVWCPDGVLASHALDALEAALEGRVTSRNAATWARIVAAVAD
ncbi:MAG: DUF1697 domain-containing protein [Planctomycetota bacterium]